MVRDCLLGWVEVCVNQILLHSVHFGSCYAVHINALSIELMRTSKGTTCKLNYYDFVKISPLFTFSFAKRGIQRDSHVYAWRVVTA